MEKDEKTDMKERCWSIRCSMFSLFDVGRSFFKQTPYGINTTCEHLQINLAFLVGGVHA